MHLILTSFQTKEIPSVKKRASLEHIILVILC